MPKYILTHGGDSQEVEVRRVGDNLYEVLLSGRVVTVDACPVEDHVASVIIDGSCHEVHYSKERSSLTLLIGGEHYEIEARNRRERAVGVAAGMITGRQLIQAPMPGRVVRVLVAPGEQVQAGQAVLTLEAMKMENELRTPVDGVVSEVAVEEGQTVSTGDKLVVVE
ncbi:MAG: biotin/lipoyl-binding protein [Thermoleophilia bacterium]